MEFEIINMDPQRYINLCVDGLWRRSFDLRRSYNDNKENLRNQIIKGRQGDLDADAYWKKESHKFFMPALEFGPGNNFAQEGLHRAMVAKKEGMVEIPVMIIYNNIDKEKVKKRFRLS